MGGTGPEGPPGRANEARDDSHTSVAERSRGARDDASSIARADIGQPDTARVWAEVCEGSKESLVLRQLTPRMGVEEIVPRGGVTRVVVRCDAEVRTLAEASRARLEALLGQVLGGRAEIAWAARREEPGGASDPAREDDRSSDPRGASPNDEARNESTPRGGEDRAGGDDHPLVAAAVRVFAGTVVRIDRKSIEDRAPRETPAQHADEREGGGDV